MLADETGAEALGRVGGVAAKEADAHRLLLEHDARKRLYASASQRMVKRNAIERLPTKPVLIVSAVSWV